MIKELVDVFINNQSKLEQIWLENNPTTYIDLAKTVFRVVNENWTGQYLTKPNFENITEIDDGDYQGTKIFMIPMSDYQPSEYYVTKVSYGSCSECDTFESILYSCETNESKVKDFMTMALHLIQQTKAI